MAKIVKLKIDADTRNAEQGMDRVDNSISKTVKSLALATAALLAFKKGFDLAIEFKNAARDAQEMTSKFRTVFENISSKADNMAESFADSFGLATSSAQKLLGNTGDLLVGFGFTEEKALEMSEAVNRLAVDLASFTNYAGGAEGASSALTKAILGETESAKSLGIVIRQDTKEFKDLVVGLMETEGVTQQQAKAQIILQQAYKQSSKAVGDFDRTQNQLANQERILAEKIKEVKEQLGNKLIPVFLEAVTGASELTDEFVTGLTPAVEQFGKLLSGTIKTMEFFAKYSSSTLGLGIIKFEDITKAIKESQKAADGYTMSYANFMEMAMGYEGVTLPVPDAPEIDVKINYVLPEMDLLFPEAEFIPFNIPEPEVLTPFYEAWIGNIAAVVSAQDEQLDKEIEGIKAIQKATEEAEKRKMELKVANAIYAGTSASKAMKAVVKAETMEAIAGYISSVLKTVPFPANVLLAAAGGGLVSGLMDKALSSIPNFSGGGDFVVPSGYPNDSYPMLVESGERVQITPANAGSSQTDHLLSMLIEEIRNKPVANTIMFDDIEMARYVESGQNKRIVN